MSDIMECFVYKCGGCGLVYATSMMLTPEERSKCPRCNPTSRNTPLPTEAPTDATH